MLSKAVILIAWALMVLVEQTRMQPMPGGVRVTVVEAYEMQQRFLNKEFCEFAARQLRREGKDAWCKETP